MTDRELLELAAKAAGLQIATWSNCQPGGFLARDCLPERRERFWNPLTDDGDALRLAVRCAQLFGFFRFMRVWLVCMSDEAGSPSDPSAATRRAIVRAAAEIGKTMP